MPNNPKISRGNPEGESMSRPVAVVTGAARGIGLGIATRFAEEGARGRESEPSTQERRTPSDLRMPPDHRVSIAVIAGPEAGRIYPVEKPRVVIGRHDADVNVDDPEISRQHAALELSGDKVVLVDMGSTNGTYVGEERIKEMELENQTEFSMGGSTLMLILTAKG